MHRKCPIIVIV